MSSVLALILNSEKLNHSLINRTILSFRQCRIYFKTNVGCKGFFFDGIQFASEFAGKIFIPKVVFPWIPLMFRTTGHFRDPNQTMDLQYDRIVLFLRGKIDIPTQSQSDVFVYYPVMDRIASRRNGSSGNKCRREELRPRKGRLFQKRASCTCFLRALRR